MNQQDKIIPRLDGVKEKGRGRFMAKCPAHQDNSPSLSIRFNDDGRVLIYCFAGCEPLDILEAIGLSFNDLFPECLGEFHPIRERQTFFRQKKSIDEEEEALNLFRHMRERGVRFTREELEEERQLFQRVRQAKKRMVV